MKAKSTQFRLMLQQYELQLLTARRLARYQQTQLAEAEMDPPDPDAHRKATVQRVAKELYERLIFTGTDNPLVDDIMEQLSTALGSKLLLHYPTPEPLKNAHMQLLRQPESKQALPEPLEGQEQMEALHLLWGITLEAVEKSTV